MLKFHEGSRNPIMRRPGPSCVILALWFVLCMEERITDLGKLEMTCMTVGKNVFRMC